MKICQYQYIPSQKYQVGTLVVAKNAGVKQEVLERSESVHQSIVDNKPLSLDESLVNKKEINDLMSNLLDLNLEDKDEIAKFMGKVRALPI